MIKKLGTLLGISFLSATTVMQSISFKDVFSFILPPAKEDVVQTEYLVEPTTTITVQAQYGSINVKTWESNKVFLEVRKKGSDEQIKATTVSIKHTKNELFVTTDIAKDGASATVDFTLITPKTTSLKLSTQQGPISVKNIDAPTHATSGQGDISIKKTTNSVTAKTTYGTITCSLQQLPEKSWIFLESLHGNIVLKTPPNLNADIQAKTTSGKVTSTAAITLEPQTVVLNKHTWKRFQQEVSGILGKGGGPITLDATNGSIFIIKQETA